MKHRLLFDAELRARWIVATQTLLIAQVSDGTEYNAGKDEAYHQQKEHAFVDVLRRKASASKSIDPGIGLSVDDAERKGIALDRHRSERACLRPVDRAEFCETFGRTRHILPPRGTFRRKTQLLRKLL